MSEDNKVLWFVKDGIMHSAPVYGSMSLHMKVDENRPSLSLKVLARRMLNDGGDAGELTNSINDMVNRQGTWYLLGGNHVVHGDDLYTSRKEAAEAYARFLMAG